MLRLLISMCLYYCLMFLAKSILISQNSNQSCKGRNDPSKNNQIIQSKSLIEIFWWLYFAGLFCRLFFWHVANFLNSFGDNVKIVHFDGASKPWSQHYDYGQSRAIGPPSAHSGSRGNEYLNSWWNRYHKLHESLPLERNDTAFTDSKVIASAPSSKYNSMNVIFSSLFRTHCFSVLSQQFWNYISCLLVFFFLMLNLFWYIDPPFSWHS